MFYHRIFLWSFCCLSFLASGCADKQNQIDHLNAKLAQLSAVRPFSALFDWKLIDFRDPTDSDKVSAFGSKWLKVINISDDNAIFIKELSYAPVTQSVWEAIDSALVHFNHDSFKDVSVLVVGDYVGELSRVRLRMVVSIMSLEKCDGERSFYTIVKSSKLSKIFDISFDDGPAYLVRDKHKEDRILIKYDQELLL